MTMTETELSTDDVLAAMLTENTGRHMLDSGGAYGRNFERNGGKTVADFLAAPEVELSTGYRYADGKRTDETVVDWITLDVFHFLRQRLEYAPDLDAEFHAFATDDEHGQDSWFECLEAWFEDRGATGPGYRYDRSGPMTVNTYNGEDSLSQVLQYTVFTLPDDDADETYIALTIHGGCDVRGGYTAPRMFTSYGEDYALMDNADFEVHMREAEDVVPDPAVEPPLPMDGVPARYPRSLTIDYRGGYADRNPEPWDDKSMDEIDFHFGETPVTIAEDGTVTIADGPAKGWTVGFYPPIVS